MKMKYLEMILEAEKEIGYSKKLYELKELITKDLQESLIKENKGNKSLKVYKTIKQILRENKTNLKYGDRFHHVYYDEIRQKSLICNGCIMLELNSRFEDLEHENAFKDFNYRKIIDIDDMITYRLEFNQEFLTDVKIKSKLKRDKKGLNDHALVSLNINDKKCWYDSKLLQYVIDILQITPDNIFELKFVLENTRVNPILIKNENGRALILPVKKSNKEEEQEREQEQKENIA
jgi:hypothetical protein